MFIGVRLFPAVHGHIADSVRDHERSGVPDGRTGVDRSCQAGPPRCIPASRSHHACARQQAVRRRSFRAGQVPQLLIPSCRSDCWRIWRGWRDSEPEHHAIKLPLWNVQSQRNAPDRPAILSGEFEQFAI